MNIRKTNMRKLQEIELTRNKDLCLASRQHLVGRMWPAGRELSRPAI
jgi:hypothetical protein